MENIKRQLIRNASNWFMLDGLPDDKTKNNISYVGRVWLAASRLRENEYISIAYDKLISIPTTPINVVDALKLLND